jgi:limonene-1,2-epoxide hydrolase
MATARRLCEQWPWLTQAEFREIIAADCLYSDVPTPAYTVTGPDAAHAKLSPLKDDWDIAFEIRTISGSADVVFVERLETFHNKSGAVEDCHLPVVGVFEFAGGKIKAWRDYWNLADAQPLMAFAAKKREEAR